MENMIAKEHAAKKRKEQSEGDRGAIKIILLRNGWLIKFRHGPYQAHNLEEMLAMVREEAVRLQNEQKVAELFPEVPDKEPRREPAVG